MIFNKEEFEVFLVRNKIPKRNIAQALKVSEQAIYNKLDGLSEFKASELYVLAEVCNLSIEKFMTDFFSNNSDLKSTKETHT